MIFFALEGRPIQEFRRSFNISEKIYRTAYEKILFFKLGRILDDVGTNSGRTRGKHATFLKINTDLLLDIFPGLKDLEFRANNRRTLGDFTSVSHAYVPIADSKKLTNSNYAVLDFSKIVSFSELLEDHRPIGPPENAIHFIETILRLEEYHDISRRKIETVFDKFQIFAQKHGFEPSIAGFAAWLNNEKGLRSKKNKKNKIETNKKEVIDPYAI